MRHMYKVVNVSYVFSPDELNTEEVCEAAEGLPQFTQEITHIISPSTFEFVFNTGRDYIKTYGVGKFHTLEEVFVNILKLFSKVTEEVDLDRTASYMVQLFELEDSE